MAKTFIILLAVPFSAVGAGWLPSHMAQPPTSRHRVSGGTPLISKETLGMLEAWVLPLVRSKPAQQERRP